MSGSDGSEREVGDWWRTSIIDMAPGRISFSGYDIRELIGAVSFAEMVWLMTRGEIPRKAQAKLLEAAMVAGVDHGPQAPSIAIARMASTCGVGINNALASAVNALGDVHGGAGEQAMKLFSSIDAAVAEGRDLDTAAREGVAAWKRESGRYLPGYGHRFHPVDPRAPRLLQLVDEACGQGVVEGRFCAIARAVEAVLNKERSRAIPLNIDGATAVIYAELGFAPALARGLFCLSRSVGIIAHAWEQSQRGERNKGPLPRRFLWTYDGPAARPLGERE